MKDYIDSSLFIRDINAQKLQDFVKQTQSDEKYTLELGLTFYFKGLPKYKLQEFIAEFFKSYGILNTQVKNEIKQTEDIFQKTTEDRDYIRQLQSTGIWLDDIQKQVRELSKELKDPRKIEYIYTQVLDLNQKMQQIQ